MELEQFFQENPRAALGFSGGVDSAYLLYAALQCGADIRPYFIKTSFQPRFELDDALRLGEELGVKITVIESDILTVPEVRCNPEERCYHCKTALFTHLREQAIRDGYPVLIDGTNASDDENDRPGMRALRELSVRSPLREAGLTKPEIRERSRKAGLFIWNKPAYACLATRIPAGMEIRQALLESVEQAEGILAQMGFSDFRVRVFHDAARLQLRREQLQEAASRADEIRQALKPYFKIVMLDLEARK